MFQVAGLDDELRDVVGDNCGPVVVHFKLEIAVCKLNVFGVPDKRGVGGKLADILGITVDQVYATNGALILTPDDPQSQLDRARTRATRSWR